MEEVYLGGRPVAWATETVALGDTFDRFCSATSCVPLQSKMDVATIRKLMDLPLTDEQMLSLEDTCSPELLASPLEQPVCEVCTLSLSENIFERGKVPPGVKLKTLDVLRQRSQAEEDDISLKIRHKNHVYINDDLRRVKNMVPGSEFVVTIRVLYPFHAARAQKSAKESRGCSQAIVMHGNNTLAELRDAIICMEEYGDIKGDVSDNPKAPVLLRYKDVYKSGMFYIGNSFYIDNRQPTNTDYSESIRKWCHTKGIAVSDNVMDMQDVLIRDLVVRFGYPYVYQHLGACEHLLIFSDARILHFDDYLCKDQYPYFRSLTTQSSSVCSMCGILVAKFIVTGCERLPRDPCFLCDKCLTSYLYIGKEKIGTFKAYRYYDRRAVL